MCGAAALGGALLLPGAARAARVRSLQGPVTINGKPARPQSAIKAGDVVVTAAGGRAVFTLGADAFLLRENSRLALDKVAAGAMIGGLRIASGALLAVFGGGQRRLVTATATIGIRGTGVYLEASRQQTYLCACYGELEVRDSGGRERRTIVSGYHTPVMIAAGTGADGRVIGGAAVKNHTDEELVMLEALVGRTSPVTQRAALRAPEGEVIHAPRPAPAQAAPTQTAPTQTAPPEPPAPAPAPAPAPSAPAPAPPTRSEILDWRLPPPRPQPQR